MTESLPVQLRDVEDTDLPIFFQHQCDPEGAAMAAFKPRGEEAFYEHWRTKILGNPDVHERTILLGSQVAGSIGCFLQDDRWLLGYWIGREFWGQGVATRALTSFLEDFPRRPLHAFVAVHNLASIRVLQKCGFQQAGEAVAGADGVEEFLFMLGASS